MSEETKSNTVEDVKEETDAETAEAEQEADAESEEESEDDAQHDDNKIDYEAEFEKERKGKPDPEKAKLAFKERQSKKEDGEEEKPLTRAELDEILAQDRKDRVSDTALQLAKGMATSDKEAQLIHEKWKNRTFPPNLTLSEQMEEAYAITHRKKLIGERNEALRALKGKEGVNSDAASAHQDEPQGGEPKLPAQDKQAILDAGFKFNNTSRRFEKKLKNGSILIRDPQTKQTRLIKA